MVTAPVRGGGDNHLIAVIQTPGCGHAVSLFLIQVFNYHCRPHDAGAVGQSRTRDPRLLSSYSSVITMREPVASTGAPGDSPAVDVQAIRGRPSARDT